MIAPAYNDDTQPLVKAIRPEGWEHLGGGLTWFDFIPNATTGEPEIEDHASHGLVVRVRPIGKVGQIAQSIARTGRAPHGAYIFSGPGGSGKTSFLRLLTKTFLAKTRRKVTYRDGDSVITLVDEHYEPFLLNPPETAAAREARDPSGWVDQAFEPSASTDAAASVQLFSADDMKVADVRDFVGRVNARRIGDQRRVFILNEVDNIRYDQTAPLKNGLDPSTAQEWRLVLADTNDPSATEANMKQAFERFVHIHVPGWPVAELEERALVYLRAAHYGPDTNAETAARLVAMRCQGSIRKMLTAVGGLLALGREIDGADVHAAVASESSSAAENEAFARYLRTVVPTPDTSGAALKFASKCAIRGLSFDGLVDAIGDHLLYLAEQDNPVLYTAEVAEAVFRLRTLVSYAGNPVRNIHWAAAAHPLAVIAKAIR